MKIPVTGDIGKQFLKSYSRDFDSLFSESLEQYRRESQELGQECEVLFSHLENMSSGGKKLRGALMALGYRLSGRPVLKDIQKLSFFMEIFHTGLLIHDDIMDRDHIRRGNDSFHIFFQKLSQRAHHPDPENFGLSMAISAGDMAFYLAWRVLLDSKLSAPKKVAIAEIYSRYAMRIVYGQVLDMSQLPIHKLTSERILQTMKLKTAEYTGVMPLEIGGTLAGLSDENMILLRKYGLALGWAFQVQDDILGLYGETESMGKPIGSDLREGKNTLLMLKLYEMGNVLHKERQRQLLGNEAVTEEDVQEMKSILEESGVYAHVKKLGWEYVSQAVSYADQLQIREEDRQLLQSLAVYMMERVR